MTRTRSAPLALPAALTRLLLRVTFVGGLLVAGWVLGSASGMAIVPGADSLDSPVSDQLDGSPAEDSEARDTEREPAASAVTTATDVAGDTAESAGSSTASVVEPEPEATPDGSATADQSPAEQPPAGDPSADESLADAVMPAASDAEPPEPVAELAGPVTELPEPAVEPARPAVELAAPVVDVTEGVVEVTGSVVELSEGLAPVGSAISPQAPEQSAPTPAVTAAPAPSTASGPVLGPDAAPVTPPGSGPVGTWFAPSDADTVDSSVAADAANLSTVDYSVALNDYVALSCAPGTMSTSGSGSAPALPGSNGALTPPAGPAAALAHPPLMVAPGLLAQRPSTSPD